MQNRRRRDGHNRTDDTCDAHLGIPAALRRRVLRASAVLFRLRESLQEVGGREAFVSIEVPLKTTNAHHAALTNGRGKGVERRGSQTF